MFSGELRELILQVLTSWQVLAATVVVFFYFFLVNYVARFRRSRFTVFSSKPAKKKKEKQTASVSEDEDAGIAEETSNDELGLEESE
jgi:hypothetical protein